MEGSESRSLCRTLVIRVSGMSGGDGDVLLLFDIPGMGGFLERVQTSEMPFG